MLPFTPEQFADVFAAYNEAIWPAQMVAYALGLAALVLLQRKTPASDIAVALILSAMWMWTGIAYHALFFARINGAAYLFAALFVAQGAFIAASGLSGKLRFEWRPGLAAWTGVALAFYAAVLYPLIGLWAGYAYARLPMFGVTPCPVTLFTFGLFLLSVPILPRGLLVVPLLWSLIGGSAAILLRVPQDWLLLASGAMAVPLLLPRDRARC